MPIWADKVHKSWILCKFAPDFKKIRRYYAKESGNSGVTR